jgi:hypothetical protein
MSDLKIGTEDLGAMVKSVLTEGLTDLVEGAEEDVQRLVDQIGADAIEAGMSGQTHLLDDLADQGLLIAEQNRIAVAQASEAMFKKVIKVAANFAIKAAIALV